MNSFRRFVIYGLKRNVGYITFANIKFGVRMPAIRNILSSFRYEVAVAKRTCDASSKHQIMPGEKHFAYEQVPGIRTNICLACAPAIIQKAQEHLASISSQLPGK